MIAARSISFAALLLALAVVASTQRGGAQALPGERMLSFSRAEGCSVTLLLPPAPAADPAADTTGTLLFFAAPNGNTAAQTLGRHRRPGLNGTTSTEPVLWEIQHVAAQARLLARQRPDLGPLAVAAAETSGLSWPSWRAKHPETSTTLPRDLVLQTAALAQAHGLRAQRVLLAAHSGGGSFLFGCLEDKRGLPPGVEAVAWLDANYSFDDERHTSALLPFLDSSTSASPHQLAVLAYDDRSIQLNGKRVVGPTGGTWRATERMRAALQRRWAPLENFTTTNPPTSTTLWLRADGTAQVVLRTLENPSNKILHTVLVERNGLLEAFAAPRRREQIEANSCDWMAANPSYKPHISPN